MILSVIVSSILGSICGILLGLFVLEHFLYKTGDLESSSVFYISIIMVLSLSSVYSLIMILRKKYIGIVSFLAMMPVVTFFLLLHRYATINMLGFAEIFIFVMVTSISLVILRQTQKLNLEDPESWPW
ncbi:hypothetical protein [Ferrimonas marina]|uniref:hypothetical protein n=1 Tax=Ferrimonas marina TaxID=299255 RepID=UPI00116126BB|nr:hypothetical protein [Ferrimonas marina]